MSTAIKVEDLSKVYHLGEIGTGTLSRDIERWWALLRGKEDPFLRLGESNDRTKKGESNIVYSLKDISFDIQQGDAVGVIGRNGAGKSTLLKILSRVTSPTKGNIYVKGRIASLLEVGTGFHPELTGRENIYLNGTILGMRKKEIDRRLDEIIDFSGIERYIDTPVKRYSSGMYVRLAFAVAAHLISEILIVDEVLAVGDAEFQKKCLGKMGEVSKGQGRTVLFVSHNMHMIQKLCNKSILLQRGQLITIGDTVEVVRKYQNEASFIGHEYIISGREDDKEHNLVVTTKLQITDVFDTPMSEIPIGRPWKVKVFFTVNKPITNVVVAIGIVDQYDTPIRSSWSMPHDFEPGNYVGVFIEETLKFAIGNYKLLVGVSRGAESLEFIDNNMWLSISDVVESVDPSVLNYQNGLILNQMLSTIEKIY